MGLSPYSRRQFLQMMSTGSLALLLSWSELEAQALGEDGSPIQRHPRPSDPDWPRPEQWEQLKARVGGRLVEPRSPVQECFGKTPSETCPEALRRAQNPFYLESQPGATQSTGWQGAWETAPSAYAVAAQSPQDVAAAVDFARRHKLRIVVKGTGHDYLGRSCAKDALLVWTHHMRDISIHDSFVPEGAPPNFAGVPALSVGAGTRWLEAYTAATTQNGRYVQGGGCTSVGAAGGFPQGGGFGSWSKKFGTGAAGMVEAEVVTSDGKILVANEYQHPDLFWALRGGGGGTFGIVTRLTLLTHPLPHTFGVLTGKIQAACDQSFQRLLHRFCQFYEEALNNEHWGEQFAVRPENSVDLSLTFQGLEEKDVEAIWAPLRSWLSDDPSYRIETEIMLVPARDMWNLDYWRKNHPDFVTADGEHYWWGSNQAEVSMYWYTYQSRYMPLSAFQEPGRTPFAQALFQASRYWSVSMHINKGLAGASKDALSRGSKTSVNPVVNEAAALAILGAGKGGVHPGVAGHEPDTREARQKIALVNQAMTILRQATPKSGSYANEADYFEPHWQKEFWGSHYPRLLEIKRRYDPIGLFHCHHGVGSEGWSADHMSRS